MRQQRHTAPSAPWLIDFLRWMEQLCHENFSPIRHSSGSRQQTSPFHLYFPPVACHPPVSRGEQFLPYAETTLTRMMQLIEEVELTETKMALLDTISNAVVRLEHRIAPFAERIVNMLPPLWTASGDEHLMKQAILTILTRLVNALKADGLPIHVLAYPIIRGAVEPGSETQVYLLDDAMDLWADILVQTPSPASAELLDLVPFLFPIYNVRSACPPGRLFLRLAEVLSRHS